MQQEIPSPTLPLLSDLIQVSIQGKIPPLSTAATMYDNALFFPVKTMTMLLVQDNPKHRLLLRHFLYQAFLSWVHFKIKLNSMCRRVNLWGGGDH